MPGLLGCIVGCVSAVPGTLRRGVDTRSMMIPLALLRARPTVLRRSGIASLAVCFRCMYPSGSLCVQLIGMWLVKTFEYKHDSVGGHTRVVLVLQVVY